MFSKAVRFIWGDMSPEELKKFSILSGMFFLIIGAYWMLRVMKDSQFDLLVGYKYQPFAKLFSPIFIIVMVLFYNKLIDLLRRSILFYTLTIFYGIGFLLVSFFILHPELIVVSDNSFLGSILSYIPGKVLGWFTYFFLESFGSIVVALFWSFVASTTTAESAKRGYGMVMALGQSGLLVGTIVVIRYVSKLGIGVLFGIGGLVICLIPLLLRYYLHSFPEQIEDSSATSKKPKTGMLEGLKLLVSKPYIAGLFVVTTMYEIINTIVEYQMGMCITKIYPSSIDGGAAFAWFKAWNGLSVGVLSLTVALFGTSFFMRKFGLRFCLMSFPSVIGVTIISLFTLYMFGFSEYVLMWAFFGAVVIFKGLSYALNNPTKEVMYIPTSKDVKFKAKSWIDAFGNRTSKGAGGVVTSTLGSSLSTLLFFGTITSLGIVAFWIVIASFVGDTFNKLQEENRIIE